MRLRFSLKKISKKPYFLECAYILHQTITRHSQDPPPKYKTGVKIALFSSSAVRWCLQKGRPHLMFPNLPLLSALLVPTHLLYLTAALATI